MYGKVNAERGRVIRGISRALSFKLIYRFVKRQVEFVGRICRQLYSLKVNTLNFIKRETADLMPKIPFYDKPLDYAKENGVGSFALPPLKFIT